VRAIIGDTPLTFIVHDIKFVNKEIRVGQYFFGDIANEGVMLFDRRRFSLAKPKALNAQERLALAERNFENWYDSATEFWRGCRYYASRNLLKHAAFLLHQATERYYHAAILVFTGYKQRTHDIELLGVQAGEQHALMVDLLPKTDPDDKHLFDLLKKAYIDARYSMSYRITANELAELQKRVLVLAERVRAACLEKIATFCGADAMRKDLPIPPTLSEPVLQNLPPPPTDPQEFGKWAQSLSELAEQRAELRWQEGKEEGRTEGFQAGEEKGIQIGEARGEAKALLVVLRSRGFDIPKEIEHRITECTDPVLLVSWLSRAATIADVSELIAG
jgi:HEPN domain-containing protein